MGQQIVHRATGQRSLPNPLLQADVLEGDLPRKELSGIRSIIMATLTDKL